jgi:predicted RND superfamily exporter protein
MSLARRYAGFVTAHSKAVVALVLVATLAMGVGAGNVDGGLSIASFESDTTEAQKLEYARENFTTEGENTTVVQVVVRAEDGGNVLSKTSLLESLRFQRAIRDDPDVNATLADSPPTVGIANLVATSAINDDSAGPPVRPSLDAQIDQLESMNDSEVEAVVARVLDPDRPSRGPVDPYALLATDYEAGATTASGRILFVAQDTSEASGDGLPEAVLDAQLAIQDHVEDEFTSTGAFAFGPGIVDEEAGTATGESFALITPVAFLLIVVLLGIAYRDVVDVALGLVGVLLVLVWMGGAMGWLGIGVTQLIIAVPFLLVGLSIDYALHVVMRYREATVDDADRSPREAMQIGLAGVIVAIGAATVSTAVGFGSNLVSPIASIRSFATVSALGILSAFVVFGLLLPALKIEVDGALRALGWSRSNRPFGRGGLPGRALGVGATLARRAPAVVLAVALVLSAGGAVAATDIDTSIDQVDFLPRDTPDWMRSLPEPFAPGEYDIRSNAIYLNDAFAQSRDQSRAVFLIEGDVTAPGTLDRLAAARGDLADSSTAVTLADDSLRVDGPLEAINRTAATNETVADLVAANDPDGDGIPEENLSAVYDAVYNANPEAASAVLYRTGGAAGSVDGEREYRALRMTVALEGGADTGTVTREMRAIATEIERGAAVGDSEPTDDAELVVTATGEPIVTELLQRGLLATLVEGFLVTFGVIVAFLTAIFYRRYGTLSFGLVVVTPVVLALAWLFGTMYLAGIAFNTETAIIASIAIGIGVDYAIHVGERFAEERADGGDVQHALDRTLQGTGGALLASAASTAGGFGVLVLALVPSLQRFGFVTATAIAYAFVASVFVLPSLLTLWTRLVDPTFGDTPTAPRSGHD